MLVVHGTGKFLARAGKPTVPPDTESTTALGSWYATVLFWRPQVALFVNEETLLPLLMPLAPASSVLKRLPAEIADLLREYSVNPSFVDAELTAMADVQLAKTRNRSVIGTMNEFCFLVNHWQQRGGGDLRQLSLELADVPCGALYKRHKFPDRELQARIAELGALGNVVDLADYRRRFDAPTSAPPGPAQPSAAPWQYRRVVRPPVDVQPPLALEPRGRWDVDDEYPHLDGPLDPLLNEVRAAGPRQAFEMEQVLPGADPDDWDGDAISDAAELIDIGDFASASKILQDTVALDHRCIDAWAHLGLIAFETDGPAAAAALYCRGVGVGEASLPDGFNGVLPRGFIDNRPFLRCLYGLALCQWRLSEWEEAQQLFTDYVWLDPDDAFNALACLEQVRRREPWTRS